MDSQNDVSTERKNARKNTKKKVVRKEWTAQEEKFLVENFNSKSNKEIAKALGRTTFSVKSKIERMEKAGNKKK